jgi:hypothetical protein
MRSPITASPHSGRRMARSVVDSGGHDDDRPGVGFCSATAAKRHAPRHGAAPATATDAAGGVRPPLGRLRRWVATPAWRVVPDAKPRPRRDIGSLNEAIRMTLAAPTVHAAADAGHAAACRRSGRPQRAGTDRRIPIAHATIVRVSRARMRYPRMALDAERPNVACRPTMTVSVDQTSRADDVLTLLEEFRDDTREWFLASLSRKCSPATRSGAIDALGVAAS